MYFISSLFDNRIKQFVAVLAFLIVAGVFMPSSVSAFVNNPKYVSPAFSSRTQGFSNCDGKYPNGRDHAQYQWISALDNPAVDGEVTIDRGDSSVDLRYNSVAALCNRNFQRSPPIASDKPRSTNLATTRVWFINNPVSVSASGVNASGVTKAIPGVSATGINQNTVSALNYFCANYYDFRFIKLCEGNLQQMKDVNKLPVGNPLKLLGLDNIPADMSTIKVKIEVKGRVVNYFDREKLYMCVAGAIPTDSDGIVPGSNASSKLKTCEVTTIPLTLTITIKPKTVLYGLRNDATPSCDKIDGWAYDGDAPRKPVPFTITVDKPSGEAGSTTIVRGKLADLPNAYVNNRFTNSAGTPHGFDVDISKYTYPHIPATRKFYIYFTDFNPAGVDKGARVKRELVVNTAACKRPTTDFELSPTAQVNLDNNENPKSAFFSNIGADKANPKTVRKVKVTRKYYIRRQPNPGTPVPIIPDASETTDILSTADYNFPGTVPSQEIKLEGSNAVNPGDQVCTTVTIDPGTGKYDPSTGVWTTGTPKTSEESCKRIVNKPFVSFYGGDVRVGGAFNNSGVSCSTESDIATYSRSGSIGSGGQLATFALGSVITNPSADISFNSARIRTSYPKPPKDLTFASDGANNGKFGGDQCIPDYFARKVKPGTIFTSASAFNLSSAGGVDRFLQPGPGEQLTLTGKIPKGKRLNLYINGDLRITKPPTGPGKGIEYEITNWSTLADIPSLHVFVNGHIYIDPDVEVITGMFVSQPRINPNTGAIIIDPDTGEITKGAVFTCANGTTRFDDDLRYNRCNKPLKINGSIVAKEVFLDRATGSLRFAEVNSELTSRGSRAAEVFDFSPEHFLVSPDSKNSTDSGDKLDAYSVLPPIL